MNPNAMNLDGARLSDTSEREILIERLIDAPRELVFAAWTDAQHIDRWWGPAGFTNSTRHMDVRVGGEWRYTMHGPDGTDYPSLVRYLAVEPPGRLHYLLGDEEMENSFEVTVLFEDRAGKTQLSMRSLFPSKAARDFVVENYRAIQGGNETIDRLEGFLAARAG
ncbi:SRPBCC family protein [Niveibacterium sp. SC-1]|uniref:SRPBCC family protein n=1 Tax=Niveibacterium sp. SC-1 TaxID=3135646 RepID=UPI00311DC022